MEPNLKPDKDFDEVARTWRQFQELMEAKRLDVWSLWTHFKGGQYRIVAVSLLESDFSGQVTYQSVTHGTVWTRPLDQFLVKFKRVD